MKSPLADLDPIDAPPLRDVWAIRNLGDPRALRVAQVRAWDAYLRDSNNRGFGDVEHAAEADNDDEEKETSEMAKEDNRSRLVAWLTKVGPQGSRACADMLGLSPTGALSALEALVGAGELVRHGKPKTKGVTFGIPGSSPPSEPAPAPAGKSMPSRRKSQPRPGGGARATVPSALRAAGRPLTKKQLDAFPTLMASEEIAAAEVRKQIRLSVQGVEIVCADPAQAAALIRALGGAPS